MSGSTDISPWSAFKTLSKVMIINAIEERGKMITPSPVVSVTERINNENITQISYPFKASEIS